MIIGAALACALLVGPLAHGPTEAVGLLVYLAALPIMIVTLGWGALDGLAATILASLGIAALGGLAYGFFAAMSLALPALALSAFSQAPSRIVLEKSGVRQPRPASQSLLGRDGRFGRGHRRRTDLDQRIGDRRATGQHRQGDRGHHDDGGDRHARRHGRCWRQLRAGRNSRVRGLARQRIAVDLCGLHHGNAPHQSLPRRARGVVFRAAAPVVGGHPLGVRAADLACADLRGRAGRRDFAA